MTVFDNEKLIGKRFDELADEPWLPAEVKKGDVQLQSVLESIMALGSDAPLEVLDCGCAKGRFLREMPDGVRAVGIDISERLIQSAKSNGLNRLVQGSASRLPFAPGSFDLIYCVETLEHLPDTQAAINEMVRVLKPGGQLIVIDKNLYSIWPYFPYLPTPIYKFILEQRGKWMYPADFPFRERYFSNTELKKRFRAAGLKEVRCNFMPDHRIALYNWFPFLSLDLIATGQK